MIKYFIEIKTARGTCAIEPLLDGEALIGEYDSKKNLIDKKQRVDRLEAIACAAEKVPDREGGLDMAIFIEKDDENERIKESEVFPFLFLEGFVCDHELLLNLGIGIDFTLELGEALRLSRRIYAAGHEPAKRAAITALGRILQDFNLK